MLVFSVLAAAIALAALIALIRAIPRVTSMERLLLFWWGFIGALAFMAIPFESARPFLIPLAGVLMIGLGLVGVVNYRGIADRLASRRTGIGPFWQQQSAASWRLMAAFLVVIGSFWALGSVLA